MLSVLCGHDVTFSTISLRCSRSRMKWWSVSRKTRPVWRLAAMFEKDVQGQAQRRVRRGERVPPRVGHGTVCGSVARSTNAAKARTNTTEQKDTKGKHTKGKHTKGKHTKEKHFDHRTAQMLDFRRPSEERTCRHATPRVVSANIYLQCLTPPTHSRWNSRADD